MARPITFLSDYGSDDEFAGICRAVIAARAPTALVIDLTHGVPRHDVRAGAVALASALPYAPPGVHLAIVDPGVGTERRAVAARAADDRLLVGPDNGLLWPALERLSGPVEAVDVSRSPVRLEPVSATFHGRDVLAPVAAALAEGAGLGEVGEDLDPDALVRLERHPPRVEPGRAAAAVVSQLDRFGNVALELAAAEAAEAGLGLGEPVTVEAGGAVHPARYGRTFADVEPGALVVHVDSSGAVALAVNQGSAAEALGIAPGDEVVLRR